MHPRSLELPVDFTPTESLPRQPLKRLPFLFSEKSGYS